MNKIHYAMQFATHGHWGQFRKYTRAPYINHPMRVAYHVGLYSNHEDDVCVGWLHDMMEDCDVEYIVLEGMFGKKVADLVQELTNVYTSKAFPDFNRKRRKELELIRLEGISSPAKLVKLIDRWDNLNEIPLTERGFLVKYLKESRALADTIKGVCSYWDVQLDETISRLEKEVKHA